MSIRIRLALLFTALVAVLLLCLNIYIYFRSSSYTEREFYTRIRDRAVITAQLFLEQDELHTSMHQDLQRKYLEILPQEVIKIYDQDNKVTFSNERTTYHFPAQLVETVRKQKSVHYRDGHRQVYGLYYSDNEGSFVILASAIDTYGLSKLANLRQVLSIGYFLSIIIVFLAGNVFAMQALQPVSDMVTEVNQITATNLDLRLQESVRKDEIGSLARTFNSFLERLENAFETQRAFVNNASHELRTPLTSIIGEVEVALSKNRSEDDYRKVLRTILTEAEDLKKLTNNLLMLAQTGFEESNWITELVRVDELLWEVTAEVSNHIPGSQVTMFNLELPDSADDLLIKGSPQLLKIVLTNLVENACKFSENTEVKVGLEVADSNIHIMIADRGIGIAEDELKEIFQPFYRASNARSFQGSGIGLYLASKIIRLHQGQIEVESKLRRGTTIHLFLPASLPQH